MERLPKCQRDLWCAPHLIPAPRRSPSPSKFRQHCANLVVLGLLEQLALGPSHVRAWRIRAGDLAQPWPGRKVLVGTGISRKYSLPAGALWRGWGWAGPPLIDTLPGMPVGMARVKWGWAILGKNQGLRMVRKIFPQGLPVQLQHSVARLVLLPEAGGTPGGFLSPLVASDTPPPHRCGARP